MSELNFPTPMTGSFFFRRRGGLGFNFLADFITPTTSVSFSF
jgi:hypothetical protein